MQIDVFSGPISRLRTEILVVACFEDIRPLDGLASEIDWFYGGILSRVLLQKRFSGALGSTLLIPTEGKLHIPKVILLGLGKSSDFDEAQLKRLAAMLYTTIYRLDMRNCAVQIEYPSADHLDILCLVTSFFSTWKSADFEKLSNLTKLTFVVRHQEQAKRIQHQIQSGEIFRVAQSQKQVY